MLVKCDAKTCFYYEKGKCKADELEVKNFEWWSEEEKQYLNHEMCATYEYDKDFLKK